MSDDLRLEIDASELEELLRKFPKFRRIIEAEIEDTMRDSLAIFEQEVTGRTPVNTGTLRGSITPAVQGRGGNIIGILGTPLVYGAPVEFGRKAGKMPPVEAIEIWVRRRLGISGDEARSAAFAIARFIGASGTKGAFMFQKGFEAGRPAVEKLWRGLPVDVVRKIERLI